MSKMKKCDTCGAEIAESAKRCPACGAKNKKPIYKRVWFWGCVVLVVLGVVGGSVGSRRNTNTNPADGTTTREALPEDDPFQGDCGIKASASMGESVIGVPELTVSVANTTEKELSAIQFYAIPYDVYGDEITGWTSQKNLYTDEPIKAGASTKVDFQLIEESVKTVKLYGYSVYYADGTEWGDKDAFESEILEKGVPINVTE